MSTFTHRLSNRLCLVGLAIFSLPGLTVPCVHAQTVWSGLDDRGPYWSEGRVVDGNGNVIHVGNWSGGQPPANGGDASLGAPDNTNLNVQTSLNSLIIAPGGALDLDFGSALTVTTTNLATDGTMTLGGGGGAYPTYTNAGRLVKTAGAGAFVFAADINFDSLPGSVVAVDSGTLQLPGGGSLLDTVTFDPAAGTLIDLVPGGDRSSHFQGTLTNGVRGGTVRLSQSTMSGTQRFLSDTDVKPCTLAFTGNTFQWTGGIIGSYQQGAIFTNTGVVNITGDGTKETYASFTNQGLVVQNDVGEFHVGYYNSGGSFTNAAGATYDLQSDANIGQSGYPFNNLGLFKKSGGTGTSMMTVSFQNQGGTVEVDRGTLQLPVDNAHGVSTGGTFNAAAGAVLDLGGNGYFTGTFTGTGAGTVRLSAGTLLPDKPNATVFNFPGNLFQWTGGIIGGYQGGQVFTNTGVVNITGGGTKETYASFTNQGLVVQNDVGEFHVGYYNSGGSFTNAAGATYDLQSDANIGQSGYPFNNLGLFKKSGGTGTSMMTVSFQNQGGTVEVDRGTLQLPVDNAHGVSAGGTFNAAAGAVLDLGGNGYFTGTFTGTGAGTVRLSAGAFYATAPGVTFNFPGALFQWTGGYVSGGSDAPFVNAGTTNLSGDVEKDNFAAFTNTGTMVQTGAGNFSVGTYHDGGSFTNAAGASYDLQSDAAVTTDFGNTFHNAGVFTKSGGAGTSKMSALTDNTGTINVNTGTLLFSAQYNHQIVQIDGKTLTGGTWNVADGATLNFDTQTVEINRANVTLNGPNAQFPSINSLKDNQGTFALLAQRQFTTAGDLSNEGTITLDAGSTLHVAGAFTASDAAASSSRAGGKRIQAATASKLHFTIGGKATQGAQSPGVLQVAGTAKMAGLIEIALANLAAAPGADDTLTVLAAKGVSGTFANAPDGARVATTDGRGSFQINYAAGSIGLSRFRTEGQTVSTPTVTIAVAGDGKAVEGSENGKVAIRRDGDLTAPLVVRYKVAGGVRAGVDYKALPGVATIPSGASQVKVKLKPVNDGAHEGTRIAKVKLKPATDGSYLLGATTAAKVRIIDNE